MLTSNYQAVMDCAYAQRASVDPMCQYALDFMKKDDRGVHLMKCMKTASVVCMAELAAIQGPGGMTMDRLNDITTCFKSHTDAVNRGCGDLSNNIISALPKPTTAMVEEDDDKKGGGGGASVVFIVVLVLCLIGALGGMAYYRSQMLKAQALQDAQPPAWTAAEEMEGLASHSDAVLANVPGAGLELKQ